MGRFWAIGVGPGDPELLTVKAVNAIRRAHVLYHAGPQLDRGRAWNIIRELVRPEQEVRLLFAESMRTAARDDRAAYRPAVERIAADCRRGLEVAAVTEGDPTLYSTASYVWQLLAEHYPDVPIEVVPGVSSITAAAARVGWPLAQGDDMLAVVPAAYRRDELHGLLASFDTVCLLKVPPVLDALVEVLAEFGPERQAMYVENVTAPGEWVTQDLGAAVGRERYFALVLVRRTIPPRRGLPYEDNRDRFITMPDAPGSPGKLWIVGIGPGDRRLLTPHAEEALRGAEVIVGYEAYLESLRPLGLTAELRGMPIGAERQRAVVALELAVQGRRVALVSSGDAGVYGMASLLLENAAALPGVEVEVVPGVTAALSAAALLGAPLGHDFACISLSDLLTPWSVIEQRLEAAGRGDFVLALYNPISQRRTWQLPQAREILLTHRPPETPVGLVDRAYRPGARVWLTTLAELTCEGVGMETLLVIGSSLTRVFNGRMVTPRGYRDKR